MTYSSSSLPPPAVFLNQETLHAISLPPLASWLISLRKPEHLIRLHDLLERYKTPQSYHRVDVRLVESSELPPGSPESHTDDIQDGQEISRKRGGSRDIVELDQGMKLEEYWSNKNGNTTAGSSIPVVEEGNGDGVMKEITNNGEIRKEAINPLPQDLSSADTSSQDQSSIPTITQTEAALNALPIPPLPSILPSDLIQSPQPIHPLPPIGPKRKIRELRLDLRTLDAAALFALETWRREELGLDKLNMEFPDSVWYKDDTPTPEPEPSPSIVAAQKSRYIPTGNKRGRPKAHSGREPVILNENEVDVDGSGLGLNIDGDRDEIGQEIEIGIMTEDQVKGYESLVDALKSNDGNSEFNEDNGVEGRSQLQMPNILDSLGEIAQKSLAAEMEDIQPPLPNDTSTINEVSAVPLAEAVEGDDTQVPTGDNEEKQPQAGPSRLTPPPPEESINTPSPDVVLNDIFNEKEDDDPDFIPPPSPPARRPTRSRRKRKSDVNMAVDEVNDEVYRPKVSLDAGIGGQDNVDRQERQSQGEGDDRGIQPNTVKSPISNQRNTITQPDRPDDLNSIDSNSTPEIQIISPPQVVDKSINTKRPRKSNPITPSDKIEKSPKKAKIAEDNEYSPSRLKTKSNTKTSTKKKARFAIEIPTKKVSQDSDDEEDGEEWGFLKSFG